MSIVYFFLGICVHLVPGSVRKILQHPIVTVDGPEFGQFPQTVISVIVVFGVQPICCFCSKVGVDKMKSSIEQAGHGPIRMSAGDAFVEINVLKSLAIMLIAIGHASASLENIEVGRSGCSVLILDGKIEYHSGNGVSENDLCGIYFHKHFM